MAPRIVIVEDEEPIASAVGADDYLTKPFSPRELVARIRTVLRRGSGRRRWDRPCAWGDVEIEADSRRVRVRGEAVHVTATEFDPLSLLAGRPAWCAPGSSSWPRFGGTVTALACAPSTATSARCGASSAPP